MIPSFRRWAFLASVLLAFGACQPVPPTSEPSTAPTASPSAIASATSSSSATASAAASPAATDPTSAEAGESLATLLARLRIAPESRAGYDRSLFVHWIDADGDGCDTRREVLIAEAISAPAVGASCSLTGGSWLSLYDDLIVNDASGIQIDHVVALAEAWDSGASGWTPARRRDFANDLGVDWALIAVSSSSNQGKSDHDPAEWLPPAPAAECPFIAAWIAVKARWDLAVDQVERSALVDDITDCPASRMPYDPIGPAGSGLGATSGPGATPAPAASSDGGCDPAYPTVCIPPPPPDLDCGQITFRNFVVLAPDPHRFDGDHDGVGCEA